MGFLDFKLHQFSKKILKNYNAIQNKLTVNHLLLQYIIWKISIRITYWIKIIKNESTYALKTFKMYPRKFVVPLPCITNYIFLIDVCVQNVGVNNLNFNITKLKQCFLDKSMNSFWSISVEKYCFQLLCNFAATCNDLRWLNIITFHKF